MMNLSGERSPVMSKRVAILGAGLCLALLASTANANPNMVANGDLEQPRTRANVRLSGTQHEAIFEIPGRQSFGRVIARGQSAGEIAKGMFVGYVQGGSSAGLMLDASEIKNVKGTYDVEVWFDLLGSIRANRKYAYNVTCVPTGKGEIPKLDMVAPAFWADGQFMGAEVQLSWSKDDKTYDDFAKRGVVETPDFQYMTGGQWLVFKFPQSFKGSVLFTRVSLRELNESLLEGKEPPLPTPTRYITIDDVLEEQIVSAHQQTAEALKRAQNQQGYWNAGSISDSVGITAYILDTLARQGEDMTSKPMKAGIKWLAEQEATTTNAIGNRLFFLANYGLPEYRQRVAGDINTLVDAQYEDGGWSTSVDPKDQTENRALKTDNSNTLDAVSALREAYYAGYKINSKTWRSAAAYFREAQARDGGFRASLDKSGGLGEATTTMNTAWGMSGLFMTLDMAFAAGSTRCTQYLSNSRHLSGLRQGMEWLDDYYDEYYKKLPTLSSQPNPIFNALSMQSFMEHSGVLYLHDKNVFRTEAEAIMRHYDLGSGLFAGSLIYSAASLNLLDAGSAPIVFQRHIVSDDSNLDFSRDGEHLARFLRKSHKKPLSWRIFDIDDPVEELIRVPIQYVHVAGEVDFDDGYWKRLRDYCFGGGVAVFNIAEDHEQRRAEVESGLAKAFGEYKLSAITEDNSILSIKHKLKHENLGGMRTIGNGLKDFVFLTPKDWSCELNTYDIEGDKTPFEFFDNLLHYTLDGDPPRSSFLSTSWESGTTTSRSMKVAHMEVGANQPVFPDLMETLSRSIESGYRMSIESAPIDKPADDVRLAWLSCAGPEKMTDKQLGLINKQIDKGAFLFAEVLTGDANWAESLRADLQKLDGEIRIRKLVANHPLLNGKLYETFGYDVRTVAMRRALRDDLEKLPRIDAYVIERDGKEVGILSTHDVGSGLGYFLYPKCRGIMPDASRRVAANLVLYSLQRSLTKSM
ncbi:MAG: hypothetical protein DHS20C16_00890 [Phycisphaerae bacterium]|nr:MAG: hypothetical protein DHS20C16_00890 [Phycisphaerae bacterium]